jgi:hypothetical protein
VYIILGLATMAMCFDLLKESMVEKFLWLACKFGLVAEDDDKVDDDNTRYANYEYAHEASNVRGQVESPSKSSESTDAPPAYQFVPPNGQWLSDIRDKDEHTQGMPRNNNMTNYRY